MNNKASKYLISIINLNNNNNNNNIHLINYIVKKCLYVKDRTLIRHFL